MQAQVNSKTKTSVTKTATV